MTQFQLPVGYKVWCHKCGELPFNKTTTIKLYKKDEKETVIPGVGFKSIEEAQKHELAMHRVWKG